MSVSVQKEIKSSGMVDAADRDGARLRLDQNIVVEAGAGTGKTTLLTDRILFTVLGAGVDVTRIVALTFTEKAAGEIHLRLSERLLEFLAFLEGEKIPKESEARWNQFSGELRDHFKVDGERAKTRGRAALENLDKAMIGTLHRFAANILRAYPIQAGVDPAFQIDEGDRFEAMFESEWAKWLDVELAEHAPREAQWISMLRIAELDELRNLAKELCHPRVDLNGFSGISPELKAWLQETSALLRTEIDRQPAAKGNIAARIREVAARLDRASEDRGITRGLSPAIEPLPGASWPKSWDEKNFDRYEIACKIAGQCSAEGEKILGAAVELMAPFADRFRKYFRWRGLLSFDGILISARDLLRDHPDVREELKREYDAFLVDEFQDTDPLQGELLMFLAEQPGRSARTWPETVLAAGKLFVVGDPKQSIYRFRGADLGAYERFVNHMLDRVPKARFCELKTNFRSVPGILDPVNSIFKKIMVYEEGLQPEYHAIHPRPDSDNGSATGVELVVVETEDGNGKKAGVDGVRETEAQWLARWILTNCGAGKKYKFKDAAILLRTTTPLGDYLQTLKERGIPYVVEGEKYFYGTQEVQDFLNLLRALEDPKDPLPMAGLLRSPMAALDDVEILALADAGALSFQKDPPPNVPGARRASGLYKILRRIHESVGRKPLGEVVQGVLHESQLLELLSQAYHGEQTLSNLLKFGRMAAESADAEGETLQGFIRRVLRAIQEAREEGESPLADESLDAVRILTIHKAKGLEYPVVLVPNLAGKTRGGSDASRIRVDWLTGAAGARLPQVAVSAAYAYQEMKEKAREKMELIRVLYVALTRAKNRLILIGSDNGDKNALTARLEEAAVWPAGSAGIGVERVKAGTPLLTEEMRHIVKADSAEMPAIGELAQEWRRRGKRLEAADRPRFTSPTAMAKSSAAPSIRIPEKSSAGNKVDHALVGQICHKVLEGWDFGSPAASAEDSVAAACDRMRRYAPEADWDAVRRESAAILDGFFGSPAAVELSKAEILGREVPFVLKSSGAQIIRGSIDLVCRLNGKLTVIDYKTDRIDETGIADRAAAYGPQGAVYARALREGSKGEPVSFRVIFLRAGKGVDVGIAA